MGGRLADVDATRNRCCPFGEPRAAWRIAASAATASSRPPTTPPPRRRHAARAAPRAALYPQHLGSPCGFAYVAQYVRRSWRHAQNGPHVAGARCGARHGGGDAKGYCRAPGRARARRGSPPRRAVAHGGLGVCVYTHRAPRVMSLRKVFVDVFYLAAAASAGTRIVAAASRQRRQAYYEGWGGLRT